MGADVKFYRYSSPGWEAGRYRLSIRQNTNIPENGEGSHTVGYAGKMEFVVTRKRFSLEEGDIYSVYPPAGSTGLYGNCLPHVVLKRDTIPWEYCLSSRDEEGKAIPGLALLVFSQDEGIRPYTVKKGEVSGNCLEGEYISPYMKLQELDADQAEEECQVVDVPGRLFEKICPSERELALLSHVREVRLDDKVTDPSVENGIFSCVTANRCPGEPKEDETLVEHIACLVSLREYEDLVKSREDAGKYSWLRLLCLYSFTFSVGKQAYDFIEIMKKLKPDVLAREPDPQIADERLRNILYRGYYPMNHKLRDGSRTVSWYRGPFLPYEELPAEPHYHVYADSQYSIDPESGMLDVSYACGWQAGRMFAMENLHSCRELLEWRYDNYKKAAAKEQRKQLLEHLTGSVEEGFDDLKQVLTQVCGEAVQSITVYQEDADEKSVDSTQGR